jgi:peptide/nickel transport system substrate-binding protein
MQYTRRAFAYTLSSAVLAGNAFAANRSLKIGVQYKVDSLAPQGTSQWALVEYGIAETLTVAHSDGSVVGWLAKSVESSDGKTWVVQLRDNVRFQNGRPMSAEVVAKALDENRTLNPEGNFMSAAKIAATGPLQVTIALEKPSAYVPAALAGRYYFPIYDADSLPKDQKDNAAFLPAKIYTGPFMPSDVPTDTSLNLAANTDYWRGAVPTSGLEIVVIGSAETRVSAVEAGDIDVATEPAASAALKFGADGPVRLVRNPGAAGMAPVMITHVLEGPMTDARVRRALGYAINYQALAEDVLNGVYLPATGLYGPSIIDAKANYVFDPAKASALLDEAGWVLSDGRRSKDGAELQLTYLVGADDADGTNVGVALQQMFAEVGIGLSVQTIADVYAQESFPTWHMLVRPNHTYGINGSPIDALSYSIGKEWGLGGQTDADVARLSEEATVTLDPAARGKILHQLQDRVLEQGLLYSLAFQPPLAAVKADLASFVPPASPMVPWDIGG